jgi:hypothetical protein
MRFSACDEGTSPKKKYIMTPATSTLFKIREGGILSTGLRPNPDQNPYIKKKYTVAGQNRVGGSTQLTLFSETGLKVELKTVCYY